MATPNSAMVHDYGPDSGGRLKGVKVVKPIVIGNVAKHFGKKREEDGHTHQWTVFLRPYLNEDYSVFIKKVQFKLHDSYPNPNRILTKPPYEVTETGWGEFEVVVKIHFNDPVERPVTVYHLLKLFEANKDPTGPPIVKKHISSESYDEIVFMEPTKFMMSLIDSIKPLKSNWKPETDVEEKTKVSLQTISNAKVIVKDEIGDLKNRLKMARETIELFKKQLQEAQEQSEKNPPPVASPSTSAQAQAQAQAQPTATATVTSSILESSVNNNVEGTNKTEG